MIVTQQVKRQRQTSGASNNSSKSSRSHSSSFLNNLTSPNASFTSLSNTLHTIDAPKDSLHTIAAHTEPSNCTLVNRPIQSHRAAKSIKRLKLSDEADSATPVDRPQKLAHDGDKQADETQLRNRRSLTRNSMRAESTAAATLSVEASTSEARTKSNLLVSCMNSIDSKLTQSVKSKSRRSSQVVADLKDADPGNTTAEIELKENNLDK